MNKNYKGEAVNGTQNGLIKTNLVQLMDAAKRNEMLINEIVSKVFIPRPAEDMENCCNKIENNTVVDKLGDITEKIIVNNSMLESIYKCLSEQLGDDLKLQ